MHMLSLFEMRPMRLERERPNCDWWKGTSIFYIAIRARGERRDSKGRYGKDFWKKLLDDFLQEMKKICFLKSRKVRRK